MQRVMLDIVMLINRVGLGLYFLLAGVAKHQGGVDTFITEKFNPMRPQWLPENMAQPYGYALPILEIVFGAALILGLFGRVAAVILLAMLASFLVAMMETHGYPTGVAPDTVPFHANYLFSAIALSVIVLGPGRVSIDGLLFGRKPQAAAAADAPAGKKPTQPTPPGQPPKPDTPQRVI